MCHFAFSFLSETIRRADWMGLGANLRKYMTILHVAGSSKPLVTSLRVGPHAKF